MIQQIREADEFNQLSLVKQKSNLESTSEFKRMDKSSKHSFKNQKQINSEMEEINEMERRLQKDLEKTTTHHEVDHNLNQRLQEIKQ